MDFFQTIGGQALASVLKSSLPKIAENLGRIATAMEEQNKHLARQEVIETAGMPLSHDALRGYMREAMGRTPHDKREEGSRG